MAKKTAKRNAPAKRVEIELSGFGATLEAIAQAATREGVALDRVAKERGDKPTYGASTEAKPFYYVADKLGPLIHYAKKHNI